MPGPKVATIVKVPTGAYLDEALALTDDERRRLERVLESLPRRVADGHTHVARASDIHSGADANWTHAVSTFPAYPLDLAARAGSVLWQDTAVWSLRMPHAVGGYRHRAVNAYLLAEAGPAGDVVGGFGLPDDLDYTIGLLKCGVAALKMYYRYREPPADSLAQVFPDPILNAAAELDTPIIVHLPHSLPHGLADLLDLAERHPFLRMVIAHAGGGGGQVYQDGVAPAYEALAAVPTIHFDTALVWDQPLLSALLAAVGPDRVLFGTDEPLSLIRAVPYHHAALGPRLYAPRYHWATDDGAPQSVMRSRPELLHLLQVEGVLGAVAPYGVDAIRAVFHDNAAELFRARTARDA